MMNMQMRDSNNQPPPAPVYLLRDKEVAERLGIGRSTLWQWVKKCKFPKPIQLAGGRCTRWDSSVIDAWIAEQGAARH